MYNLELAQRWMLNEELQAIVPDPSATAKLKDIADQHFRRGEYAC